jgi:hypothetical protein
VDGIVASLAQTEITVAQALLLIGVLACLPLMLYFAAAARAGHKPTFRRIRGYEDIQKIVGLAADTARPVHMSLGTGGIADASAAESLAGLAVLQHVARSAVASGAPLVVSLSDPTLLPLAQEVAREAWESRTHRFPAPRPEVRLISPDPSAFAAGAMDIVQHEDPAGNVLLGRFGQEYLLIGEAAARSQAPVVAGAQTLEAMPFVQSTADGPVLGEEVYAATAYLQGTPAHVASLRLQDWMRVAVALVILVGVVLRTAQVWR